MKNAGWVLTVLSGSLMMMGCLEDKGEKVNLTSLNSSDFIVQPPTSTSTSENTATGTDSVVVGSPASEVPQPDPELVTQPIGGILINQGDLITNNRNLSLQLSSPFDSGSMKISENLNCDGGTWVDYSTQSSILASTSGLVSVSVLYKDFDGPSSLCFKKQIIIDQKGPDIVFSKYPVAAVEEGTGVEIVYSVTDDYSQVASANCIFANISKPCAAGTGTVIFPEMAEGTFEFVLEATDGMGNRSEKRISFSVTSTYKSLTRNIHITENNKVDILFVIDNSGSMAFEQRSMANRVRNFLDVVKGLDWQIGVSTTDPRDSVSWGDGKLLPMSGLTNTYILNSTMDDATARTSLSNTLQRRETGSGVEQGIRAAYRMLERGQAAPGVNSDLIREGAQLAIVLISDEDESANEFRNDPTNLVNYVNNTFRGQKSFSFHSIITRPGDRACLSTQGATEGFRYDTISKLTGGVIGDVCATDYAAQVLGVAEGVRKTLKSITLTCAPVITQTRTVQIKRDGVVFTGTYSIQGLNLVFDQMLPAGEFEINYSCLK